jgi:hypothetical protein
MAQPPYRPDENSRAAVMAALRNHRAHRGWSRLAAHVRTNHVHAIVEADVRPERVMNEDVQEAIQYVIDEQGEPMALFVAQDL